MSIHVKNGTPLDGPPLCESCTHAHIERGYRQTELRILCDASYPTHRVAFPVRECTGYISKNRQVLEEMERLAWILSPRGPKRAGFVSPGERQAETEEIQLTLDSA
jgi:hypothetical protein